MCIVANTTAKNRQIDAIPLDWKETGHHVFPIELLRKVAEVERKRRRHRRAAGSVKEGYPYALAHLVHCAQCTRLAQQKQDPTLRRRLTGSDQRGTLRYVHAEGIKCGCQAR